MIYLNVPYVDLTNSAALVEHSTSDDEKTSTSADEKTSTLDDENTSEPDDENTPEDDEHSSQIQKDNSDDAGKSVTLHSRTKSIRSKKVTRLCREGPIHGRKLIVKPRQSKLKVRLMVKKVKLPKKLMLEKNKVGLL